MVGIKGVAGAEACGSLDSQGCAGIWWNPSPPAGLTRIRGRVVDAGNYFGARKNFQRTLYRALAPFITLGGFKSEVQRVDDDA